MSRNNLHLFRPLYESIPLPSGTWNRFVDQDLVAHVAMLAPRVTHPGNYFDQGPSRVAKIVAPSNMRDQDLTDAIEYTLSTQDGCGHDYDCCGCAHHSARVIARPNRREYVVLLCVGYNY